MANPNTGVFASGEVATLVLNGVDISEYCESVKISRKGKDDRHRMLGSSGVVVLTMDAESDIDIKGLIDPTVAPVFTANQGSGAASIPFVYSPQGPGGMTRSGTCKVVDYDEDTEGSKGGEFTAKCAVDGNITDA